MLKPVNTTAEYAGVSRTRSPWPSMTTAVAPDRRCTTTSLCGRRITLPPVRRAGARSCPRGRRIPRRPLRSSARSRTCPSAPSTATSRLSRRRRSSCLTRPAQTTTPISIKIKRFTARPPPSPSHATTVSRRPPWVGPLARLFAHDDAGRPRGRFAGRPGRDAIRLSPPLHRRTHRPETTDREPQNPALRTPREPV